jgi:UDP:flavonoid glycosyltransferase YjiC (YdhE family)
MRCLSKGVPVAVIPAKALDQAPIATLVEGWGAGVALPGDADARLIESAVDRILADPSFASAARELSGLFVGPDGAVPGADALERLAGGPRT